MLMQKLKICAKNIDILLQNYHISSLLYALMLEQLRQEKGNRMSRLELKNICKNFGDFVASKDISFIAEEGEMVTLLGPSGCGKTTLLKMIGGFHTPDSGEIIIGDEVVMGAVGYDQLKSKVTALKACGETTC